MTFQNVSKEQRAFVLYLIKHNVQMGFRGPCAVTWGQLSVVWVSHSTPSLESTLPLPSVNYSSDNRANEPLIGLLGLSCLLQKILTHHVPAPQGAYLVFWTDVLLTVFTGLLAMCQIVLLELVTNVFDLMTLFVNSNIMYKLLCTELH